VRPNPGNSIAADAEIPIRIELGPALAEFTRSSEVTLLERRVESEFDALLERIGLAGRIDVEVSEGKSSSRPVRIYVHERLQPYAPHLLRRAWLAVAPPESRDLPDAEQREVRPGFSAAWLGEYLNPTRSRANPPHLGLVSIFLQRLVVQAVLDRPSCLLGAAQLEEYGNALTWSPRGLAMLLRTLLDLGVSLKDRELVRRLLREGEELKRPFDDTIEAVFTELRPQKIEILVHPATLAELVDQEAVDGEALVYDERIEQARRDLFRDFERAFYTAFGFLLPSLVWVPSPALAAKMVAVRIGTWRGLPVPMPPEGTRLVLTPSAKLSGFDAQPTFDPVSGGPCSIVADTPDLKEQLEKHGYTTWGPVDFALVILGSELPNRVGTLLGMEEIEYQLAQLPTEPDRLLTDVTLVALRRFSLGDLTRVMRALVSERLSMLDLSGLLERLVQYETVRLDYEVPEPLVLDERLPTSRGIRGGAPANWRSYYAFLRRQLSPYLSYFHGGTEKQILAYSLKPWVEDLARQQSNDALDDDLLEAFRDAVWSEFSSLTPDAAHVIITTTEARHPIRDLLAPEFPDLPILAYAELSPDVDLHLLGEIRPSAASRATQPDIRSLSDPVWKRFDPGRD
jgi:FHIPEP family protein